MEIGGAIIIYFEAGYRAVIGTIDNSDQYYNTYWTINIRIQSVTSVLDYKFNSLRSQYLSTRVYCEIIFDKT